MSDATLNGKRVLRAEVRLPVVGAWHADVDVDSAETLTGKVTLAFDGGLSLVGTVVRGGIFVDRLSVRIVGGAGGLGKELPPKHYKNVTAAVPLADILSEAGETLGSAPPEAFFPHWTRMGGAASSALDMLAAATKTTWRVQPDGAFFVGAIAWSAVSPKPYELLESYPAEGRDVLGVETPSLLPGTVFQGSHVRYVVHHVTARFTRTEVYRDAP